MPNPGYVFWLFVFWYSILRSALEEPFRDNPLPWQVYLNEQAGIGLFTYTQLASIPCRRSSWPEVRMNTPPGIGRSRDPFGNCHPTAM